MPANSRTALAWNEHVAGVEPFAERGEVNVAIDEPGEDGQAGGIDCLGIAWRLNGRTPTGMRDPSVFYNNDRFASRLPGGRVEEAVSVDSPNHRPMLVLSELRLGSGRTAGQVVGHRVKAAQ